MTSLTKPDFIGYVPLTSNAFNALKGKTLDVQIVASSPAMLIIPEHNSANEKQGYCAWLWADNKPKLLGKKLQLTLNQPEISAPKVLYFYHQALR